jgi:hypothetical protein
LRNADLALYRAKAEDATPTNFIPLIWR